MNPEKNFLVYISNVKTASCIWSSAACALTYDYVKARATDDPRYTFSAKEKPACRNASSGRDDETQYSYFGARYYDSDLSVWLSVDPMSDIRTGISPYNYCQLNPVVRFDPSGALDVGPDEYDMCFKNDGTVEFTWKNSNGGENTQIISVSRENENGDHVLAGNAIIVNKKKESFERNAKASVSKWNMTQNKEAKSNREFWKLYSELSSKGFDLPVAWSITTNLYSPVGSETPIGIGRVMLGRDAGKWFYMTDAGLGGYDGIGGSIEYTRYYYKKAGTHGLVPGNIPEFQMQMLGGNRMEIDFGVLFLGGGYIEGGLNGNSFVTGSKISLGTGAPFPISLGINWGETNVHEIK